MTNEEAVRKLEYSKAAYQMLIDEKVDSGKLVGKDVKGEWKADTPLDEAYKSMIEALEMGIKAIKALDQEPCRYWQNGKCNGNTEVCEDAISRQDVLDLAKKGVLVSNGNYESVCKAINELPSVNPQPCEDAISRQAALGCCRNEWEEEVEERLKSLPPVNQQEPKTGHWEQYGNSWEDKFKCSECGKEQPKILCGERIIGHWSDYCPNCGCRMVEPQESENKE